jgi:hypothetical protein
MTTLALLLSGCARGPAQPKAYALDEVPAEFSAQVATAEAAFKTLQQRLLARLTEEMGRGGPVGAIDVCRNEAQMITAEVEKDQGVVMGRTSHRVRNPGNAPRDWVRPYVDAAAGKKAADVKGVAVDLGDRVGVLRPIPTGAPCIACHGSTETMAPEIHEAIRAAYPDDQATGFSAGDLRGYFWAEVKK